MKQLLAIRAEWAWSQKALENLTLRRDFAQSFFLELQSQYPYSNAMSERGIEEILRDVEEIYKKLSYGGRRPESMHPLRLQNLLKNLL